MYSLFEGPKIRKNKTLVAASAVVADFDKLQSACNLERKEDRRSLAKRTEEIDDLKNSLKGSMEALSSSSSSSNLSINTHADACNLLRQKIEELETEVVRENERVKKITGEMESLSLKIKQLRELINDAYTGPRTLHSNWADPTHCVITKMTYLIREISNTLSPQKYQVPASIVRYRLAERAELPGEWQYHQLNLAISLGGYLIGTLLIASALFALLLSSSSAGIFFLTVVSTGAGLWMINVLAIAACTFFKVHPAKTLAVRLLGTFQDIGEINNKLDLFTDKSSLGHTAEEVEYLTVKDKNVQELSDEIHYYCPN
ncbi:MAG: hypothetical protein Q8R24_05965 [Legionellaceae bacterium]|nr:hypothetical protein [Legionellaceae bacterium]